MYLEAIEKALTIMPQLKGEGESLPYFDRNEERTICGCFFGLLAVGTYLEHARTILEESMFPIAELKSHLMVGDVHGPHVLLPETVYCTHCSMEFNTVYAYGTHRNDIEGDDAKDIARDLDAMFAKENDQ